MDIYLSAASRNTLLSLQNTQSLMGRTNERLATGLKVNTALDNPNAYFTAQTLEGRASDLGTLLEDQEQSIQTIKAADKAIQAISTLLETAKAKANAALTSQDANERAALAVDFNTLLDQLEGIAEDAGYKGINLLGGDNLQTIFNEDRTNTLTTNGIDYTDTTASGAGQLDIDDAVTGTGAGSWGQFAAGPPVDLSAGTTNITTSLGEIQTALETVRAFGGNLATSLAIVDNRINWTKDIINTLQEGSGKLKLADQNEESANLLALQTRQQLGTTALSLTNQAEQGVLRLF
ncbi:MAG: flagellin [Pseudomonadota bacterium]